MDVGAPLSPEDAYKLLAKRPVERTPSQIASLAQFVRGCAGCTSLLSQEVARTLCLHLRHRHFADGEPVLLQGQINTNLYVVLSGHCQLFQQDAAQLVPLSSVPSSRAVTEDGFDSPSQQPPKLAKHYSFRSNRRASWASQGDSDTGSVDGNGAGARSTGIAIGGVADPANLGESAGLVETGEAFGELGLLEPGRPCRHSVVAEGGDGVHCLLLDRVAFGQLSTQAGYGGAQATAVQSLLAALCLRPLKWAPELRSDEDTALLARLLQGLGTFKALPAELCGRLAGGMERCRAPDGATVIEEGDSGDCMYILLSGSVEVRQQPEPERLDLEESDDGDDDDAHTTVTAATRLTKQTRLSTGYAGTVKSSRRTRGANAMSAVEKDAIIAVNDKEADRAGLVVRNGSYWVNQFMESVRKVMPAQEVTGEGMTPLATIAAAKWRWMTVEERDKERRRKEEEEAEKRAAEEEKLREAGVYRNVLGMGAAKAVNKWREQALAARKAEEEALAMMKATHSENTHRVVIEVPKRFNEEETSAPTSPAQDGAAARPSDSDPAAATTADGKPDGRGAGGGNAPLARRRWARAGLAVNFTVKARNLIDPNRRMMDRIAKRNPGGLTSHMLGELSRRANVEDVLGTVSKAMMRRGAPRKISVNNSRKLYEAINHTIERGASDRGFAGGGDNRSLRSLRFSQGSAGSALETMSVASSTSLGDHPDLYDEEDGRGVSSLTGAQREHNPGHRRTLTRNALLGDEVPVVGVGADGKPVRRLLAEGVTDFFGPLVRTLSPGSSFGELALLQRSAMRTASVLVPSREEVGEAAEFRGVELIRVTRECYDQTVNMLMSQQLSELLQKVAKVEPFKALPRQHLSSLAVFMRSATYERGAVIVRQDEAAEQLFVIMQGEARVLGKYDAGEDLTTLASAPKRRLSDRAAERVRGDEDSATPSAAQVRAMNPHEMRGAVRLDGVRPGRRAPGELVARWGGVGGLNGAGIVVHGGAEVSGLQRMAPLAVIGEGQAFGEEVLGLTTAAVRCNEDGEEFLVPQYYGSTVVATSATLKVLSISARDLRRFGSKMEAAVRHYARLRAHWRQERLQACRQATAAASPALAAEMAAAEMTQHGVSPVTTSELHAGVDKPLVSAAAMMARRRSDTDAQRVFDRRGNLPPQFVLNVPPPPHPAPVAGRFPKAATNPSAADKQAAILNRIWSMPTHAGRPTESEAGFKKPATTSTMRRFNSHQQVTQGAGHSSTSLDTIGDEPEGDTDEQQWEEVGVRLPPIKGVVSSETMGGSRASSGRKSARDSPRETSITGSPLSVRRLSASNNSGRRMSTSSGVKEEGQEVQVKMGGKLASGRPVFKLTVSAGPLDFSTLPPGVHTIADLGIIGMPAAQNG